MKIVNLILAVMFLVFAFLQINDPDPLLWIGIYGALAVICVLAAFRIYSRAAMVVLSGLLLVYGYFLLPGAQEWWAQEDRSALFDDVAKMEHLYIEEARELLGLLICIVVLIFQLITARRKSAV
jgi:hypothetical protein